MTAARSPTRWRKAALVAVAAVAALSVGLLLVPHGPGGFATEAITERVRASGPLGPLALIALLVFQAVIAPIPSPPILMAAGFVYGPWTGFGIGWLGLLLGAGACFGLARALGRPFAERFVSTDRLGAIDDYVGSRSGATFITVLSLRVFMPPLFDAVSYGCGLVRVPVHWFVLATALGEMPKVATFTYLGAMAGSPPTWLQAWIVLVPVVGLVGHRLVRRALRAHRPVAAG